jgi:hypothetical protein
MRRAHHAWAWSSAVGTLLGVTLSARAAPPATKPPARDPAAAEALFEQGRRALEKNDLVTACAKFAESQRLDPGVGTLMNWATCEERQGHIATAWQRWREALAQLPADDDRLAFARQRVAALEPRLPQLSITLRPDAPSDARVQRDGVVLGRASLGTALPVDPGVRSITVDAPGFEPRAFQLAIAEGEKKSLEVEPGNPLPRASPADSSTSSASPRRAIGWTLVGAGAAGVVTGLVTGLMVDAKRDDVDANCPPEGCSQRGLDAADDGKTLLVVNAVGWGVGIAGLAAGTYLVLSSPRASHSAADTAVAPRAPAVGVSVAPGGFAFAYRSRF